MRFWLMAGAVGLAGLVTAVGASSQVQVQERGQTIRPGVMARDTQPEPTGTALIRGRVLSAETGSPLRRAQVRLSAPELRGGRVVTSDADGRYEFRDLPAGRYTMTASKGGYVSLQFGQRRAFEQGKPIELLDRQVIERADFSLPRGSAITGRILDEFGEPVADAFVQVMRYAYVNGRRQLMPAGRGGQTNDLGLYRVFGLPPGDYHVSATVRGLEMLSLEMGLTGGMAETTSYAPTYYPGTASPAEAQRLTVALGQETGGVDFALMPVRTARITGVAIDSEGKPAAGAMIMLMPRSFGDGGFMRIGSGGARVEKDGSFTVSNVPPGDYVLQVRSGGVMSFMSGGGGEANVFVATTMEARGGPGAGPPQEPEFAMVPISVGGQDITGLTVVTGKGGRMTGRVVFEDAAPPARERWQNMRIMARPIDVEVAALGGRFQPVSEDGSFEVTAVAGNVLIRALGMPPGWTLKSVEYNGLDITDTPMEFKGTEEASGVVVTLTALRTEVTGSVSDDRGQPVKDYTTVVFAEDSARWGAESRFIKVGRPDQDGRFKIEDLPPGDYLAVALDYVQQGEWYDPALLERVRSRGQSFRVAAGGSLVLDLKITTY